MAGKTRVGFGSARDGLPQGSGARAAERGDRVAGTVIGREAHLPAESARAPLPVLPGTGVPPAPGVARARIADDVPAASVAGATGRDRAAPASASGLDVDTEIRHFGRMPPVVLIAIVAAIGAFVAVALVAWLVGRNAETAAATPAHLAPPGNTAAAQQPPAAAPAPRVAAPVEPAPEPPSSRAVPQVRGTASAKPRPPPAPTRAGPGRKAKRPMRSLGPDDDAPLPLSF